MRIALVISSLQAGGAERVISHVAAAAVSQGWQTTLIAFDRPDEAIFHPLDPAVKVSRLALPPGGGRLKAAWTAWLRITRLRRELRDGQFDIVISFLTKINIVTLVAAGTLRMPVIVSERNNPLRLSGHPVWDWLRDRLYPRAAAIVAITAGARSCLPAKLQAKTKVIPNPTIAMPFKPSADGPLTLTAAGRLTHQKGFDILVDAFARIAGDFPDWRLVIWGEGADRGSLEAQVRELGLGERIALPGSSPQPGSWIESATIFILSSRYEGWAGVVAEAMAAGLPVIASNCDFGPAEMIDDGVSGILVACEDSAALADAMARLMSDADLRERIARTGTINIAEYDIDSFRRAWLSLVNEHAL